MFYISAAVLKASVEHHIVFPYEVDTDDNFVTHNIHHRTKRSLETPDIHYHIPFKNERFHLELKPNDGLMIFGLEVEWSSGKRRRADRNCHFIGSVRNYTKSSVAISNCRGLVSNIGRFIVETDGPSVPTGRTWAKKRYIVYLAFIFSSWISCEICLSTRQV